MSDNPQTRAADAQHLTTIISEAAIKFGGPLVLDKALPSTACRAGYISTFWKAAPKDNAAAVQHGRDCAYALMSIAPDAVNDRQTRMVHSLLWIVQAQIVRFGGNPYPAGPEREAFDYFWEIIARFLEPHLTASWLAKYKPVTDQRIEEAREDEKRYAAYRAERRSGAAKRAAATRKANLAKRKRGKRGRAVRS